MGCYRLGVGELDGTTYRSCTRLNPPGLLHCVASHSHIQQTPYPCLLTSAFPSLNITSIIFPFNLRLSLPPLPAIKAQPTLLRLECNDATLRKEEDVPLRCLDALPALVRDLKIAVHDDLHLVVGVGVDERGARVEAVKARGDGVGCAVAVGAVSEGVSYLDRKVRGAEGEVECLDEERGEFWRSDRKERRGGERREDVAQEGILIPYQREGLCEFRLCVGVVLEGLGGGGSHCGSGDLRGCGRRLLFLDGAKEGTH